MSGEIISGRKVCLSLVGVQDQQVQWLSPLQPYCSHNTFFFHPRSLPIFGIGQISGGTAPGFPPWALLPVSWFSPISQEPFVPRS